MYTIYIYTIVYSIPIHSVIVYNAIFFKFNFIKFTSIYYVCRKFTPTTHFPLSIIGHREVEKIFSYTNVYSNVPPLKFCNAVRVKGCIRSILDKLCCIWVFA